MFQKLPHFIAEHWILVSAFVLSFLALVFEEARSKSLSGKSRLSPQEAVRIMNKEEGLIVDIRDLAAYQAGHVVGAVHLSANGLENNLSKLDSYNEKSLIIACQNGQKSIDAMRKLRKAGYTNLYLLVGGMNAWKNAGMPLKR